VRLRLRLVTGWLAGMLISALARSVHRSRTPQQPSPMQGPPAGAAVAWQKFTPDARLQAVVPHQHTSLSTVHCPLPNMDAIRPALATLRLQATRRAPRPLYHCLHTTASWRATPLPHPSVPGPPPETPTPAPTDALYRVARKKKQAGLLQQAKDIRAAPKPGGALAKRFWKDVTVKEAEGTPSPPLPSTLR
jgi:hypothetical protein